MLRASHEILCTVGEGTEGSEMLILLQPAPACTQLRLSETCAHIAESQTG